MKEKTFSLAIKHVLVWVKKQTPRCNCSVTDLLGKISLKDNEEGARESGETLYNAMEL